MIAIYTFYFEAEIMFIANLDLHSRVFLYISMLNRDSILYDGYLLLL